MSTVDASNRFFQKSQIKETENQAKFVSLRVDEIEKLFSSLCTEFVGHTRRTAKLRNNGDELSRILLEYAVQEKISRSTSCALKSFSENLATLEDYRHTKVDRIVNKIINPLAAYGEEIKAIRQNLKVEAAARKKQILNMRKLEKSKTPESSRQAEILLQASTVDATKCSNNLEQCILEFESRRLHGLKQLLTDFVQIEMLWHAKALETLSDAYNSLQILHTESDMEDFRSILIRSGARMSICGPDALDYYSPNAATRNKKKLKMGSMASIDSSVSKQTTDNRKKSPTKKSSQMPNQTKVHIRNCASNYNNDDVTSLFTDDDDGPLHLNLDSQRFYDDDNDGVKQSGNSNNNNGHNGVDDEFDDDAVVEVLDDHVTSLSNSPRRSVIIDNRMDQYQNLPPRSQHSPLKSVLKTGISKP